MADFAVVVYNSTDRVKDLLAPALNAGFNCLILDNTCNQDAHVKLEEIAGDKVTLLISSENLFFSKSVNKIMNETKQEVVFVVCGEHTHIKDFSWLTECEEAVNKSPTTALAGCVKYTPGFMHYKSLGYLPPEGPPHMQPPRNFKHLEKYPREVIFGAPVQRYVPAGFFAIRRSAYEKIGPFDEDVPHIASDVEYSLRSLMSGFMIGGIPGLFCVEKEGEPHPKDWRVLHSYNLEKILQEAGK